MRFASVLSSTFFDLHSSPMYPEAHSVQYAPPQKPVAALSKQMHSPLVRSHDPRPLQLHASEH